VVGNGISGSHQQYQAHVFGWSLKFCRNPGLWTNPAPMDQQHHDIARMPGRSAMGGPGSWVQGGYLQWPCWGVIILLTNPNNAYGKQISIVWFLLHKMGNFWMIPVVCQCFSTKFWSNDMLVSSWICMKMHALQPPILEKRHPSPILSDDSKSNECLDWLKVASPKPWMSIWKGK